MTYGVPEYYEFSEVERLRRLSVTDELTGLLNRRYFFNRLAQEISKTKRNKRSFSLLILDVDHFKEINDTYGHLEGDEVLRVISKVLLRSVREMDVVTRYAGDEFIAILPEADKKDAYPVAVRILEETKKLVFKNPKGSSTFSIGVSVGISTFPQDGETATELIEKADHGLYTAKKAGRNRVCFGEEYKETEILPEIVFEGKIPNFIGRNEEIKTLFSLYQSVLDNKVQVVFVTGEAGVGKTSLIHEFSKSISKENVNFLQGTCFDTKIPMPYQPFREALAGFIERDEYYGYSILRALPESAKIEIIKIIPGLDLKRLGITSTLSLDPVQDEYRLFDGIYQIFKKISEKGAVVLLLDDIHWADTASLEMFSYLVRNAKSDKIMVCLTYRPEEIIDGNVEKGHLASTIHKLGRIQKLERIVLQPLSRNHVIDILNDSFKPYNCPKELIDVVFRETEGNPFFVEELLKSLIENKIIEFKDKKIILKSKENINLPSSIRDLVLDRIDRLPEEVQELLRIAAAIGQEFTLKLLSIITDKNEGHIQDILDSAMDSNIIKEDYSASEEKFSFTHCKMREVLYYSLRESKRERLHLKIAQALEKLYFNNLDKHYENLAQHYYLSRNNEKAFTYMMLCAQKVMESYATHEAVSYFTKNVSIYENFSTDLKQKFKDEYTIITLSLGKLHNIIGEYDKALHWLHIAKQANSSSYEVYLNLGEVYVKKGEYEKALEHFKIALCKTSSDNALANIETNMSYVYFRISNFNDSELYAKQAIKRLEDKNISLVSAEAYKNLGTVYYAKGMYSQAINFYSKSLDISLQLNDKRAIANSYNNIGSVYYRKGDYVKSLEHLQKCLGIREEIGDKSGIVYSYNNIGNIYYNRGEFENAEKYYLLCLNISNEIGELAAITASYNNLGNVYLAKEDFDSAEQHYSKSLEISEKIGEKSSIARAYTGLGNVYFNRNQFKEGYSYYLKCYDIRKQIGDKSGMAFASIHMAFTAISLGDFESAEKHFIESGNLKEEIGDFEGNLTITNQLVRLYLFIDNYTSAKILLESAVQKAEKLESTENLAEIWGLYTLLYISLADSDMAKKSIHSMEKFAQSFKFAIPVSNFISFVKGRYAIYCSQYKKALPLLENSLKYRRIKNSDLEYGQIMLDYAMALIHLKRFDEALEKLHIAEKFAKNISMSNMLKKIKDLRSFIEKPIPEKTNPNQQEIA